MRQTSGIIINDEIFINSSHVVKITKYKNDNDQYCIDIYLSFDVSVSVSGKIQRGAPITFTFDNENDCITNFKRIIMEMYGNNYSILDF